MHVVHELGWEFLVHPAFDEGARLAIDRLLDRRIVLGCVEELLAVDQSAVIRRKKFGQGWDLAQVGPMVRRVQISDDPIDIAGLESFLCCHWLVEHENFVSPSLAELLHEGVSRTAFR